MTKRIMRALAFATTGGMLLQTAGCATSLAPLALSLIENILLSQLLAGLNGF